MESLNRRLLASLALTAALSLSCGGGLGASVAQADERPPATTRESSPPQQPQWTQRPEWQVTRERRQNRPTPPASQPNSTEKQLHWRNPERHSPQLENGQVAGDAPDVFTARTETAAPASDTTVQLETEGVRLETEGRVPSRPRSLFDDAPSSIEIAARRANDPFNNPFDEQPQAVSQASHHDVFGSPDQGAPAEANPHVFAERDQDVFNTADEGQLADEGVFADDGAFAQEPILKQVDQRVFTQTDEPTHAELPLAESAAQYLTQSSELTGSDLEDLLSEETDPFQNDPNYPTQTQPLGSLRGDDLNPPRDGTDPEADRAQEPNLFPTLDEGELAEQDMLDDLLQDKQLSNERLPDEQGTEQQRDDARTDEAPNSILGDRDVADEERGAGDSDADKVACKQIYNDRNCCEDEAVCERARQIVHEFTLDKISLDIAPPYAPGEDDPEVGDEKRLQQLAKSASRVWTDREGNSLVTGQFYDLSNGNVIILRDDGTKVAVRLRALSQDALCFVNSWWQLPAECRLSAEDYQIRDWTATTFTWKASALCHKPLYFEDAQLERYGHSAGPIKQPLLSGAHFFANVILLPYNMGLHPPNECRYALGYYRPGNCAPWLLPAFPLSIEGAAMQTIAVTGLIGILP